jgi:hypothetical protein
MTEEKELPKSDGNKQESFTLELIDNLNLFVAALRQVTEIEDLITFYVDKQGMFLQCMDSSRSMLVNLRFPALFFASFVCENNLKFSISLANLCNVLKYV